MIKLNPTIGIIGGRGHMGAYFAEIFKKDGFKVLISDKTTKLTNTNLAEKADVVIVSVPIDVTEKVINQIAPKVRKEAVLVDLTSLKEFPVAAMLKAKSEVIGLHPMFSHTNPLSGQTVITCPVRSKKWYPWLKKYIKSKGAKVIQLTPTEHDRIMGTVQALVHFADIAFGDALKELNMPVEKYLKYASPASELKIAFAARLLAQDPDLYANIELRNPHVVKVLTQYLKSIEKLLKINKKGDLKAFKNYFNRAGKYLADYKGKAFNDTNYLIHALLERRSRDQIIREKKKTSRQKTDLAVLGPENTFSDIAAIKYVKSQKKDLKIAHMGSIYDVFEMVDNNNAKLGIAPLENLLNGTVRETFNELFDRNIQIIGKFSLPIKYALVSQSGVKKKDVDTIMSHEQAIMQCKKYLHKNFPQARLIGTPSTIAAYEKIKGQNERQSAAIIPLQIAEDQKLNILAKNIGDNPNNRTSFVVLKKGKTLLKPKQGKKYETSITFYFDKDKPGALHKIFRDFADANINMSRIESRPLRKEPGNYCFFLDFMGSINNKNIQKVISKVEKKVKKLKILGSYPVE